MSNNTSSFITVSHQLYLLTRHGHTELIVIRPAKGWHSDWKTTNTTTNHADLIFGCFMPLALDIILSWWSIWVFYIQSYGKECTASFISQGSPHDSVAYRITLNSNNLKLSFYVILYYCSHIILGEVWPTPLNATLVK